MKQNLDLANGTAHDTQPVESLLNLGLRWLSFNFLHRLWSTLFGAGLLTMQADSGQWIRLKVSKSESLVSL